MAFGTANTPGILSATPTRPGLMLPEDKAKLDDIASGAQVNVLESVQLNGTALTPSNKAVNIPLATENAAGLMSAANKTKLDNEVLANLQTVTKSSLVDAVNELCNSKASARDTITFYVAVDGDDTTGNGSAEHPFASLEQAIDKLNGVLAKSTIYIKAGT